MSFLSKLSLSWNTPLLEKWGQNSYLPPGCSLMLWHDAWKGLISKYEVRCLEDYFVSFFFLFIVNYIKITRKRGTVVIRKASLCSDAVWKGLISEYEMRFLESHLWDVYIFCVPFANGGSVNIEHAFLFKVDELQSCIVTDVKYVIIKKNCLMF